MRKFTFLLIIAALIVAGITALSSKQVSARHHARGDDNQDINLWIDVIYYINATNMSRIRINIIYDLHKIGIEGTNFTAKSLRENWTAMDKSFEEKITKEFDQVADQLCNTTFPNDTCEFGDATCNYSSINTPSIDDYNPPIQFTKNITITFNLTSYGFKNPKLNLEHVLRGTLKMGAEISKKFTLGAAPGYNNTYILDVPDYIKILSSDEDESDETATWNINYLNATNLSASPIEAELTLTIGSREVVDLSREEIITTLTIDLESFENLTLYGGIEIKSVDLGKYNISLPSNIKNLSFISADWLRMAFDNGLANISDLENEINKKLEEVEDKFYSYLNTTLNLTFKWNLSSLIGYDVKNMPCEPPLKCSFNSTKISLTYENFDPEVLEGFLNAGGKFRILIPSSKENYTLQFILPENINLSATVGEHKLYGNRNSYHWNSLQSFNALLFSDLAPEYTESKIDLSVTIDFYKINVFRFAGNVNISFSTLLYWAKVPTEFSLPENVTINYINADLIRLLLAKNIFRIETLTKEYERAFSNLTSTLSKNATMKIMKIFVVNETLQGYNLTKMSGEKAIEIRGFAELEVKLSKEKNVTKGPELALFEGLVTVPINFTLQGIKECNTTTYKLIFPKGIKILKIDATFVPYVPPEEIVDTGSEGGRDYFEACLMGNETCTVRIILDLTPFITNFLLPFITIGIIFGVAAFVIKILIWREGKFIKKVL